MRGTVIARWTGRGKLSDLVSSVREIMRVEGKKARVSSLGRSVLVEGAEPAAVVGLLAGLPGVDWIAVGKSSTTVKGLTEELARLAGTYLKSGATFAVRAESAVEGVMPSDLMGAANSAILDAKRGVRVNEGSPSTTFRIALDRGHGAAAVELARGPGGAAMGGRQVAVMVSGGVHSSVVAWDAMVSGFSVRMVHWMADEESLTAVARLYAELSHRADPRKLALTVLEGGSASGALAGWAESAPTAVFAGFHAEGHHRPPAVGKAEAPLYLLPEEEFDRVFSGLGFRPRAGSESWRGRGGPLHVATVGGFRGDVHAVLDAVRKRRRSSGSRRRRRSG